MNKVNNGILQTRNIKHPFSVPLATFHGHIVKTFSPLPSSGKCLEIVKRVILAAVAPFAYLALVFVSILGYPFTIAEPAKVKSLSNQGHKIDISPQNIQGNITTQPTSVIQKRTKDQNLSKHEVATDASSQDSSEDNTNTLDLIQKSAQGLSNQGHKIDISLQDSPRNKTITPVLIQKSAQGSSNQGHKIDISLQDLLKNNTITPVLIQKSVQGLSNQGHKIDISLQNSSGNNTPQTTPVPIHKRSQNPKSASQELFELTQDLYLKLSHMNGDHPSLSASSGWQIRIVLTIGEVGRTIRDTSAALNSLMNLEEILKKESQLISRLLSTENTETFAKIKAPIISLDGNAHRNVWIGFLKHISQSEETLTSYLSKDSFPEQLQLLFGDKGEWFSQTHTNLSGIYEYYDEAFKKMNELYDQFSANLVQYNVSKRLPINKMLDKHKMHFKENLDKLKEKRLAFELVHNNMGHIVELAQKVPL